MRSPITLRAALASVLVVSAVFGGTTAAQAAPVTPSTVHVVAATHHLASTSRPVVRGTHRVGSRLHVSVKSWKPKTVRLHFRWKRDGHVIAKATQRVYTVRPGDAGKWISVTVTGKKAHYKTVRKTSHSVLIAASSTATPNPSPVSTVPSPSPSAPAPAPVPVPTTSNPAPPAESTGGQCDPNYAGGCVPIAYDVDCAGGSGNGPAYVEGPVQVVGRDIYGLDADGDGLGCE
jgi:hypothetical protein